MDFLPILQSLASGFPYLVMHFGVTVALWAIGVWLYIAITPYKEMALIRQNNVAAAVSLAGAMLGLAIPLAFAMAVSVSVADIIIWGIVTIFIQIAVYRVIDLLMRGLAKRVEANEIAPAIFVAAAKLSVAAFNAAAVSG